MRALLCIRHARDGRLLTWGGAMLAAALSGCSNTGGGGGLGIEVLPNAGPQGRALIRPSNNSNVTGTILFSQRGDKVSIVADIHELTPGRHSIYIHEVGNCSSPNAASAGKVWAAPGTPPGAHRLGDLPELVASTEGNAYILMSVRGITVGDGKPTDVIGHSIVVHGDTDPDPQPQFGVPNKWFGCGVIEAY
jgi:Cu-Zn family superoxide dismutase